MTILYPLINIIYLLISVYTWILVIYAFMSWFPMINESVFGRLIRRIVDPYLSIFDRIPTRFGIFDFKVIIGLLGLLAIQRLILFIF